MDLHWTEIAELNTGRNGGNNVGTNEAAIVVIRWIFWWSSTANTEVYNGSSWTEVNDLNTI